MYDKGFIRSGTDNFTFQSGSIQIIPILLNRTYLNPLHSNLVLFKFNISLVHFGNFILFTFQSGSIQINLAPPLMLSGSALHSNLVLFKYEVGKLLVKRNTFTFQSGSIQMQRWQSSNSYRQDFTFQSGSIQM